jgi:N-acetyl-beta-hexosaminidase
VSIVTQCGSGGDGYDGPRFSWAPNGRDWRAIARALISTSPRAVSFGGAPQTVDTALTFTISPASADLSAYAETIRYDLFLNSPAAAVPAGSTKNVNVNVANVNVPLALGVDESYTLTWPADGSDATLTAKTVFGAYMGLQTLSQAVRYDFDSRAYAVAAAPLVISDAPKFAWRGILIDTDRHWLSIKQIRRIIDALGMTKLNILHWHIVDWQSWPLASNAYPLVWSAAWSKRERVSTCLPAR